MLVEQHGASRTTIINNFSKVLEYTPHLRGYFEDFLKANVTKENGVAYAEALASVLVDDELYL